MNTDAAIGHWLSRITSRRHAPRPTAEVHGGSISFCRRWRGEGGDAFVKIAALDRLPALEAEAEGLRTLAEAAALRVPEVLGVDAVEGRAVLALGWLELESAMDNARVQAQMGEGLAMQHRVTTSRYGWRRDNTIGSTLQVNAWSDDWVRFYRDRRLGFQLDLAARNGLNTRTVERGNDLGERCGDFFSSYRPIPSLLHGDLWGGNWGVLAGTRAPVIFDPAVYFGDRETDLAMARLFGGFGPRFYAAYESAWPLDPAVDTRRVLYNLYHVLNHYNLFGGAYGRQADAMIERLLAELG